MATPKTDGNMMKREDMGTGVHMMDTPEKQKARAQMKRNRPGNMPDPTKTFKPMGEGGGKRSRP